MILKFERSNESTTTKRKYYNKTKERFDKNYHTSKQRENIQVGDSVILKRHFTTFQEKN